MAVNKNKTISIVQITRIGDLIQTYQMAKMLKEQHPEINLILIARRNFGSLLEYKLYNVFSKIYYVSLKELLTDNINESSLHESLEKLDYIVNQINENNICVNINLSYSKSSSWLSSLIKSKHKIGPYYDSNGIENIQDTWSKILSATVLTGNLNPFSLVDLYKFITGVKSLEVKDKPEERESFNSITIHPFSSHSKKYWKPLKWVEIIYKILKDFKDIKIYLVGGGNEINQARQITKNALLSKYQQRIVNLVGKTSLAQLEDTLSKSDLFIGHDSMVGHLAALNNIPSLTISLGTVRPFETTPYKKNSYTISPKTKCFPCFPAQECNYYQCHFDIPYQAVNHCIRQLIKKEHIDVESFKKEKSNIYLNNIDIYKSDINEYGLLILNPINHSDPSIEDIFRIYYRIVFLFLQLEIEENIQFPILNKNTADLLHQNINGEGQGLYDFHVGPNGGKENIIQFDSSATDASSGGLGVDGSGISDKSDAVSSLETIDEGIKNLSGQRASLGAIQNRLNSAVSTIEIQTIQQDHSRSIIEDADIALSSSRLAKNTVMKNAAVAALAQANSIPLRAVNLI